MLDLNKLVSQKQPILLIDVRQKIEFEMCHLPFSINIQLSDLKSQEFRSDLIKKICAFNHTLPNCK